MFFNRDDFPKQISFYQHGEPQEIFRQGSHSVKISVINGMGVGIGDSIVGLRALDIFYERMVQDYYAGVSIDMFQRIKPELRTIYQRNRSVNQTYDMPQTLAKLLSYDYFMSLEAFTLSSEFNSMPMIDYFLAKLGIDPATVNDHEKRNTSSNLIDCGKNIDKTLDDLLQAQKNREKLLLIHPVASDAIRSVPDKYILKMMDFMICNTEFVLVVAVDIANSHERFVDLSRYS